MAQQNQITTVRPVFPIHIHRQLVLDSPVPVAEGSKRRSRIAIVPIENLDDLRRSAKEKKAKTHNIVFNVRLGMTEVNHEGNPNFSDLVELITPKQAPVLEPEAGEDADEWLTRAADAHYLATRSYGTDILRIYLEQTEEEAAQAWREMEEFILSRGLSGRDLRVTTHDILCTLYVVSNLVVANIDGVLLALPGVPKMEREAVVIRNEIYGYQTPALVLEAVRQIKKSTSRGRKSAQDLALALSAIAVAPNGPAERALYHVLAQDPQKWQTNVHEATKFFQTPQVTVTYQPTEVVTESWRMAAREATLEALDKRFRSIRNDLAADIADILFHHWTANARPNSSPTAVERVAITLSKICEYRGIVPTTEAIQMLYEALRDVRAISLNDGLVNERLFDISTVEIQPPLWHCETAPQKDTGLIYSPGFFLSKAVKGEPIFEAPFMRRLWELDPYRHHAAKRLGRYLRGEWRMNAGTYLNNDGGSLLRFRLIKDILDDAGISYQGTEAKVNPSLFIRSTESQIDVLYNEGIIREGCPYIYHPEDRERRDNLPRKGILARWLQLRIRLDPPAEVRDVLARYHSRRLEHQAQAKALPEPTKRTRKPRDK